MIVVVNGGFWINSIITSVIGNFLSLIDGIMNIDL